MRQWIVRLLVAVQVFLLVAGMPITAHAEPTTGSIIIAMLIVSAISTGVSMGVQAITNAFRKPKPGNSPIANLQLTTSREGEGIPRIYGKFAVGAKVIWKGSITSRSVTSGSGKRRTPPTTAYSTSLGLLVCENIEDTILGISRIWADNELCYSVDPSSLDGTNPSVLGTLNGPFLQNLCYARRMQILLGQSTQTDRCDWYANGDDNAVPGGRGYVQVFLDDMNMEPFYNRIPQFQIEVVQGDGTGAYPTVYECHLAGLDDDEIDIESEPSFGFGCAIDGPQPYKNLLELCPTVCVAEVDGTLKFMPVPGISVATINYEELGAIAGGREEQKEQPVKFAMTREQSATIPSRVEVTYADPDNRYQQASVGYARQYGDAQGLIHLQVPFAHTRASAVAYASAYIARSWTERDTLKFSLLPKYVELHCGDVVTLEAPNGQFIDCRITTMDWKPGTHPVEITAIRQLRGTGAGNPGDMMPEEPDVTDDDVTALPSVSILSNVPPLIDDHDGFAGIYWAAGPLADSTTNPPAQWKGATLFRNACGSDDTNKVYEAMAFTRTIAVIGVARTELADGSGVDSTNTVDVEFSFGSGTDTIVGVHDDAFMNTTTANLCILGQEVLQFRDVTDVSGSYGGDNVWRLSELKRGLRATSTFTDDHAIGDVFVLWNPDAVIRVPINLNEQGGSWNFKTLSSGQEETEVDPVPLTVEYGGLTVIKDDAP